jgi:hypothetical protein
MHGCTCDRESTVNSRSFDFRSTDTHVNRPGPQNHKKKNTGGTRHELGNKPSTQNFSSTSGFNIPSKNPKQLVERDSKLLTRKILRMYHLGSIPSSSFVGTVKERSLLYSTLFLYIISSPTWWWLNEQPKHFSENNNKRTYGVRVLCSCGLEC